MNLYSMLLHVDFTSIQESEFLQWIHLDSATTNVTVLQNTTQDVFSFIFAISVEIFVTLENGVAMNISSGMTWSDCTYIIGKGMSAE